MNLNTLREFNVIFRKRLVNKRNGVLMAVTRRKDAWHYKGGFFSATGNPQAFIPYSTLVNNNTLARIIAPDTRLDIFITAVSSLLWSMARIVRFKLVRTSLTTPQHSQVVKKDRLLILRGFASATMLFILINIFFFAGHFSAPR